MDEHETAPIDIKPRDVWHWQKPDYKPVIIPQPLPHVTDLQFKWYERVQWKAIAENVGMFLVGVLKIFPKTTLIGEALGKLFKSKPTLIDKLLELIQLIIDKFKSWRK